MKHYSYIVIALVLICMTCPLTTSAGVVTQGQFAGMLSAYLNATNEQAYSALSETFSYTNLTIEAIPSAVTHLQKIGLSPFGGWRSSEPMRLHDMASLVVRCHHADETIDLSDKGACVAFAKTKGCDFGTIQKVVRHIWEQKWGSNIERVRTSP